MSTARFLELFQTFKDHNDFAFERLRTEAISIIDSSNLWASRPSMTSRAISHAHITSVFVDECRPRNSTPEAVWLALMGTLIFFYLDDLPDAERSNVGPAAKNALRGVSTHDPNISIFVGFRDVLRQFNRASQVMNSFIDLIDSMITEATIKQTEGFSLENYDLIRQQVVFVRQYQEIWTCGEHLQFPPGFAKNEVNLTTLSSRIIALVNDIASKDSEDLFSLNKIQLLVRSGESSERAAQMMRQEHNQIADEYLALIQQHKETYKESKDAMRFIEQSLSTTQGNLKASIRLVEERYPDAVSRLSQYATHPLYDHREPMK